MQSLPKLSANFIIGFAILVMTCLLKCTSFTRIVSMRGRSSTMILTANNYRLILSGIWLSTPSYKTSMKVWRIILKKRCAIVSEMSILTGAIQSTDLHLGAVNSAPFPYTFPSQLSPWSQHFPAKLASIGNTVDWKMQSTSWCRSTATVTLTPNLWRLTLKESQRITLRIVSLKVNSLR